MPPRWEGRGITMKEDKFRLALGSMTPDQLSEFIQALFDSGLIPIAPCPASPVADPQEDRETPQ